MEAVTESGVVEPGPQRDTGGRSSTGVRVEDSLLTLYSEPGRAARAIRLALPEGPRNLALEQVWREALKGETLSHAVLRNGTGVRALFLAEDRLPKVAVRLKARRRCPGRWLVSGIRTEGHGGRIFFGPDLFLRQVDIGGPHAWLATALVGFGETLDVRRVPYGEEVLYAWELDGHHYLYALRGGRWGLYGAGNTPLDRIEAVLEAEKPETARDHLWAVGAIKIA